MADLSSPKIPSQFPSEADEEVQRRTLRDYYIILRERLWIALPLAILVAVSVGYWQARLTPMYSATATMQFDKPPTIVTTQGVIDASIHSDMDINTQIGDMQSNKVRQLVLSSFTPEEEAIIMRPFLKRAVPGQPPPTFGAGSLGDLIIEPVRASFLIRVTVHHPDPDAAAIIANKYVHKFMDYLIANTGDVNDYATQYLTTEAQTLQEESEKAENAREQYLRDRNLVSLDPSQDSVADALKVVQSNLTQARVDELGLQTTLNQIEQYQAQKRSLLDIDYIARHGNVASLRGQLDDLNQQRATLAERYLARHPKMIDINEKISVVQGQLDAEIAQAVADLKTTLNGVSQRVAALEAEKAADDKREVALQGMRVEYSSLVTKASVAKSNYQAILDRLNETTTSKNIDKLPLHPLDDAVPNYAPYQPDLHRIVRTCVGLGLLVFVGVAMGLSFIDDRIKSAWDVEAFIGVSLLGIIPDLSAVKEDKHSLVISQQQTPAVEAFLGVYSAIKIQSKLDFPKSILVTSTIPGEGKTLVSSNLAASFARHGKRTVLVDCDLRRPMLHRHFKQQNNLGLIYWFENGASLDGPLSSNPQLGITKLSENFSVLTSGGRSKSPTAMLEQPIFGQLLEKLKKEYDVVVVDSPPMGAVTDALLIAERTDEVIYVCRFNRAYRKHIKLYIRALLSSKNAVLGIVLNGLSPRRIEYYSNYRYYRSYKKYYGSQT